MKETFKFKNQTREGKVQREEKVVTPEEILGELDHSKKNIYEFGLEVQKELTQEDPFKGLEEKQREYAICSGNQIVPEGLPKHWDNLLKGCLETHPSKRWGHQEVYKWRKKNLPIQGNPKKNKEPLIKFCHFAIIFSGLLPIVLLATRSPRLEMMAAWIWIPILISSLVTLRIVRNKERKNNPPGNIRNEILEWAREQGREYLI